MISTRKDKNENFIAWTHVESEGLFTPCTPVEWKYELPYESEARDIICASNPESEFPDVAPSAEDTDDLRASKAAERGGRISNYDEFRRTLGL